MTIITMEEFALRKDPRYVTLLLSLTSGGFFWGHPVGHMLTVGQALARQDNLMVVPFSGNDGFLSVSRSFFALSGELRRSAYGKGRAGDYSAVIEGTVQKAFSQSVSHRPPVLCVADFYKTHALLVLAYSKRKMLFCMGLPLRAHGPEVEAVFQAM